MKSECTLGVDMIVVRLPDRASRLVTERDDASINREKKGRKKPVRVKNAALCR